ncbi:MULTISPECIES: CBS domain-containing protein [Deinococcus]|uniref:CBS domain-containing protein n=1 Tax=Deinococcus multiflagellatus TaxID=1656887 RepID=A0ABW1ZKZ6_9DEIO|nr:MULTISPECIES: CBS domain-containing protein [Deinococcus]MBZ9713882.1 CBS domain-containing protein [Deinococcus multiflagellatus]
MPTLKDIMTRDLTTTDPRATLKEVATLMREQDIGNVLIMDGETLQGIITDRDIVVRAVAYGHDLGSVASDYATGGVFTLESDTDVQDAARQMAQRQVRRLPVTENGQVVGIVSLGDLATRTSGGADEQALQGISQPTI